MTLDPRPLQGAWVLNGTEPEWEKAERLELKRIYHDVRPERSPQTTVPAVRAKGFVAGVYWGANWGEQHLAPDIHARNMSLAISNMERQWRQARLSLQCEFMLDYEQHDPEWIAAWLRAWRHVRPTKRTTWTLESHQGGWFTPELVALINRDVNLIVLPQLYNGAMQPPGVSMDGLDAVLDLVFYGVDPFRIQGFYDAREIPLWFRGFLFTLESAA